MSEHLKKYVQYIRNTGRVPLKTEDFDDDWDPIGAMVRRDLRNLQWIVEDDGEIRLTDMAPL